MNKIYFLSVLLVVCSALAQESAKPKEKKLSMSFEDELVKGETIKPDSAVLNMGKGLNYKKLIRLRENFIPEAQKGRGEFSEK